MIKTINTYKTCKKCSGIGRIDCYSHVSGGRCFNCGGSGKIFSGTETVNVEETKTYDPVDLDQVQKESAEFDYSIFA